MNKEWSLWNKSIQTQLKKEASFHEGIQTLLKLRKTLVDVAYQFKSELSRNDFNTIPFIHANGYRNKIILYSLWHVLRIEDIVVHTLIQSDEQVFFRLDYQNRIRSPLITTGNELIEEQIEEFSKQLNVDELYQYMKDVTTCTNEILCNLSYYDLKREITEADKQILIELDVVSTHEDAYWLIDYWCHKNIRELSDVLPPLIALKWGLPAR